MPVGWARPQLRATDTARKVGSLIVRATESLCPRLLFSASASLDSRYEWILHFLVEHEQMFDTLSL